MSIWHTEPDLERLNKYRHRTLVGHLGIRFTEIGPDYLRATMAVDDATRQPLGLLHGGASCALAETVASTGATLLLDESRQFAVGMEINANHVRAIREGQVTATARPLHVGGRSQVWSIDIHGPDGALICVSRMTIAVVDRRPEPPG